MKCARRPGQAADLQLQRAVRRREPTAHHRRAAGAWPPCAQADLQLAQQSRLSGLHRQLHGCKGMVRGLVSQVPPMPQRGRELSSAVWQHGGSVARASMPRAQHCAQTPPRCGQGCSCTQDERRAGCRGRVERGRRSARVIGTSGACADCPAPDRARRSRCTTATPTCCSCPSPTSSPTTTRRARRARPCQGARAVEPTAGGVRWPPHGVVSVHRPLS